MNGNYSENKMNPFSVPPPNFNQRATSWHNDWRSNLAQSNMNNASTLTPRGSPQSSSSSRLPSSQPLQNHQNIANSTQGNEKYVNVNMISLKRGNNEVLSQRTTGDVSPMSVPPPPLPPYMANSKTPMYSAQHMYSNRLSATGMAYHGPVAYVPIAATHNYYLPSPHSSPMPPPPPPSHYSPTPTQRNYYYKRKSPPDADYLKKLNNKKKKKPLSQNIPQRKDWSVEDSKRAIDIEKELNKRKRSASLIIKFPDTELNRDIVAQFHPGIESVHFQQPSTPRFCFITLKDSVNAEDVIERLNKIRFGQGFLSVEYKKDREDDMNIGPEDIDPLTLYVGNLAQDVMKEDMVKIYPKHKRVDIGYAKKMKYTRYAFVSFKNIDDSIEAFTKTHSMQLYSKSLIVRFRRLHGTVGMPGEPKPQLPQKHNDSRSHEDEYTHDEASISDSKVSPWDEVDVSHWGTDGYIKQERIGEETDEENEEYDDLYACLPDVAKRYLEDAESKPNKTTKHFQNSEMKPLKTEGKLSKIKMQPLSSVSNDLIDQDVDEKPYINVENGKYSQHASKKELEEKPTWLVEKKSPVPKVEPILSKYNTSKPLLKPFLEPKQEQMLVDEEKIDIEKPTLTESTYVHIKQEQLEDYSATESESHTEIFDCETLTQSTTNVEVPLVGLDEPTGKGHVKIQPPSSVSNGLIDQDVYKKTFINVENGKSSFKSNKLSSEYSQHASKKELEEKPSWLVEKKSPVPKVDPTLSKYNWSKPLLKPFLEPKQEQVFVDEEKIDLEKPTLTESKYVQIKQEQLEDYSTTQPESHTIIGIKTDIFHCETQTQSTTNAEVPLVGLDEPTEKDEEKYGDEGETDDEDDFNFGDLLNNLDGVSKKLETLNDVVL